LGPVGTIQNISSTVNLKKMYLPHKNLGLKDGQILGQKALAMPTLGNALIFKNPFSLV
jgi:hypothetical protein